jgi:hypothetical protein
VYFSCTFALRGEFHARSFSSDPDRAARPGALKAHRDALLARLATCITVLTAAIAVLIVAAAAVAFAITGNRALKPARAAG